MSFAFFDILYTIYMNTKTFVLLYHSKNIFCREYFKMFDISYGPSKLDTHTFPQMWEGHGIIAARCQNSAISI